MDQTMLSSMLATHAKLDGKTAWNVAGIIWGYVKDYGSTFEAFGVKKGEELERKKADKEIQKEKGIAEKLRGEIVSLEEKMGILKSEKAQMIKPPIGGELTKEQVVSMIRESAEQGNAASQKILSEYIGLGKHEEDMVIQMMDYSDAPDWYKTKGPE